MKLKPKKKLKYKSYSKLIFSIITTMVISLSIFVCIMAWRLNDISIFQILIPCVFTEFATTTAFYYSKAKAENIIKIKNNPTFDNQFSNLNPINIEETKEDNIGEIL